jgi:hypothetical protein
MKTKDFTSWWSSAKGVCACFPFWCPLVTKRAHHSLVSISSAWARASGGDGTWPALQAFQLYCKCKHPQPLLALDNLTNNFGIKFFLGLTKEKDEGGGGWEKVLSSSWKARVEVRLTMLKKAKLERDTPLNRVQLRRILSPNVSFSAIRISLVQRGLRLFVSGIELSCHLKNCHFFFLGFSYMVPLDPRGDHLLSWNKLHPAWQMTKKEWCHWAFPIFAIRDRRPPKPVWQGDTWRDSVEGIKRIFFLNKIYILIIVLHAPTHKLPKLFLFLFMYSF